MKKTNITSSEYLSELEQKIHTRPPDEASYFLLEASTLILLASFPEISYQGFLKLTEGELKISKFSLLAYHVKEIIHALCYFMKIPCPSIFSEPEMSWDEVEKKVHKKLKQVEFGYALNPQFNLVVPFGDWSEGFLEDTSHLDRFIQSRWRSWASLTDGLNDSLSTMSSLPNMMQRLAAGALQNQINISQ